MDWRSINFDWNQARAFLVTAEEGSLSAAARSLELTQPTMGRQVAALEKALGVALFERIGKGFELTPAGLELLEYVRSMGNAANHLSLAASGQSQQLAGSICISVTEVSAAYILPPVIQKLRSLHPGIEIEIIASNSTSDLTRREADIAIRAFRPTQQGLIARKLYDEQIRLYASPAYLASLGGEVTKASLSDAVFIGFDRSERLIDVLNEYGLHLDQHNFPIITLNHLVHWELVKSGLGVGVMPDEIGDREQGVVQVLPDLPPIPVELWLVSHRELKTNRRIRTVFDFLVQEFTSTS